MKSRANDAAANGVINLLRQLDGSAGTATTGAGVQQVRPPYACTNNGADAVFVDDGDVLCVPRGLNSVIDVEYRAALNEVGRGDAIRLQTGDTPSRVAMRGVYGDRLMKQRVVVKTFLETLSDKLLGLNPMLYGKRSYSRTETAAIAAAGAASVGLAAGGPAAGGVAAGLATGVRAATLKRNRMSGNVANQRANMGADINPFRALP